MHEFHRIIFSIRFQVQSSFDVNLLSATDMPLHEYGRLSMNVFKIIINREDFDNINGVRSNRTPYLHFCLMRQNEGDRRLKAIAMIHNPKIDLSIVDSNGKTAFDIAYEQGHNDIAGLIFKKVLMSKLMLLLLIGRL